MITQKHLCAIWKLLFNFVGKNITVCMKRLLSNVLLFVFFVHVSHAQTKWNERYQTYINQYRDLAIEQMLKHGVPASITLAQGLLESGAGRSELALKGNNHFGIKCHGWTGRTTYHDDDERQECFRAYDNVFDSYEDHSMLLTQQPRYKSLFELNRKDYKGWAKGLKACGYATSPTYAKKLINIIELYKLHEYDSAKDYDRFMASRPQKENVSASSPGGHPIRLYNKNYYVVARAGDTFKSLGKELGCSPRKLARYNERPLKAALSEGDIVYLKKKQKRAPRQYKGREHTVKAGESMYSISQYYGMRLKKLYKKNHLPNDYSPKVGDKLKVY